MVYFGPEQPEGVKRGNWIQTMPNKGWFAILRRWPGKVPADRVSNEIVHIVDLFTTLARGLCYPSNALGKFMLIQAKSRYCGSHEA